MATFFGKRGLTELILSRSDMTTSAHWHLPRSLPHRRTHSVCLAVNRQLKQIQLKRNGSPSKRLLCLVLKKKHLFE